MVFGWWLALFYFVLVLIWMGFGGFFVVVWSFFGGRQKCCGLFAFKNHRDLVYDMISIKPDSLYAKDYTTRIGFLHSPLVRHTHSSPEALAMFSFFK